MSLHLAYDPENIFAKIIRGDMPAVTIHETDETLAFMDIFPQSEGHCLIIPKRTTAVNLLDMPTEDLRTLIAETQRIARAVEKALQPDGVRIAQFNGAEAGQTVFHIHFHVIPAYAGAPLGRHGETGPADTEHLKALATKIAAAVQP